MLTDCVCEYVVEVLRNSDHTEVAAQASHPHPAVILLLVFFPLFILQRRITVLWLSRNQT